jgi:hypothetical protein
MCLSITDGTPPNYSGPASSSKPHPPLGHPRYGGRGPGTPNKATAVARAGLQSAIETLRNGDGEDPVKAAIEIARLLEEFAHRRIEALAVAVGQAPLAEFLAIRDTLKAAADIHLRLSEFAFPKLQRVDYAGDAPPVTVQNRVKVTVKLGAEPPPWTTSNGGDDAVPVEPPIGLPPA